MVGQKSSRLARKRTMITATDTIEQARPFAAALVEREERRSGSRMVAYENVASTVGTSSSWLRKFIGRQPDTAVAAHVYLNIISAYRSLCERVEAAAERERHMAAELREKADAAVKGASGVVARATRAPGPAEEDL